MKHTRRNKFFAWFTIIVLVGMTFLAYLPAFTRPSEDPESSPQTTEEAPSSESAVLEVTPTVEIISE